MSSLWLHLAAPHYSLSSSLKQRHKSKQHLLMQSPETPHVVEPALNTSCGTAQANPYETGEQPRSATPRAQHPAMDGLVMTGCHWTAKKLRHLKASIVMSQPVPCHLGTRHCLIATPRPRHLPPMLRLPQEANTHLGTRPQECQTGRAPQQVHVCSKMGPRKQLQQLNG